MRPGYRAFLMGTATDLPTRGFTLDRKSNAQALLEGVRKWEKVVSNLPH